MPFLRCCLATQAPAQQFSTVAAFLREPSDSLSAVRAPFRRRFVLVLIASPARPTRPGLIVLVVTVLVTPSARPRRARLFFRCIRVGRRRRRPGVNRGRRGRKWRRYGWRFRWRGRRHQRRDGDRRVALRAFEGVAGAVVAHRKARFATGTEDDDGHAVLRSGGRIARFGECELIVAGFGTPVKHRDRALSPFVRGWNGRSR